MSDYPPRPKSAASALQPLRAFLPVVWLLAAIGYRVSSADDVQTATPPTRGDRADADWWSLQPIARPAAPDWAPNARCGNEIDSFIQQKLDKFSLPLAQRSHRPTLLRRAKLDLLGLPPTPAEIAEFVCDQSDDAYARRIDQFLASPHYGERWGRHWLDVVRFGESDGFENDKLREHSWRYRDYVIRSLNADIPYDQFVREQLAGDCLEPITRDSIIATGFLAAGPWDEIQFVAKSASERLRAREEQQEELLATVGQTFLGLTVHCARCHDHKFDPILQTDYYSVKAVFDGVDHRTGDAQLDAVAPGTRSILTPAEQARHEAQVIPVRSQITYLNQQLIELQNRLGAQAVVHSGEPEAVLGEGKFGRGLNPRQGYAEVAHKPAYHSPPLTVECWANLSGKSSFNILIAAHPKESADHWELYSYAGSGEFSVYMPGYEPAEMKSGVEITDDGWHYVAMTFDGSVVELFLDGRPVRRVEVKRVKTGASAGPLWVGAYPPQKIGCDGQIDEVRISNKVRTISSIPIAPFTRDENTVGLWHFDSLAGRSIPEDSQVTDSSELAWVRGEDERVRAALSEAQRELASLSVPVTYAGIRRQPDPTRLFLRGDIQKPGPVIAPSSLSVLAATGGSFELPAESAESLRRARFARWLSDRRNPLLARVMVNRIWHYHFGRGLVETPSDFGFQGGLPSHSELLDWLADEFLSHDFSIKHMHRLIMASETYQQSSDWCSRAGAIDSDNRWLWRFSPRRLEAEIVRDSMLAVSGELNTQMGGPSFRPFTTTALLTQFYHLVDDGRPEFNRRTIYRINVNTAKDPLLDSLDCPAPSVPSPSRRTTTTALQALALMNDSFVLRQADRMADRLRRTTDVATEGQIREAVRMVFGREATASELTSLGALAAEHGLENACWVLLNSSEFLHVR